jgi:anthranilate phosphoribosyltransferase
MEDFRQIIQKLVSGRELLDDEIIYSMNSIMQGKLSEASIASFLVALRMKGETSHEVSLIMRTIKEYMIRITPKIDGFLIDICGTGGGKINTFNISTASAIIASSAGAKVAKHCNRSASGICGSADFMESVGLNLEAPIDDITKAIQEIGLGFLYAPKFHPAMQKVASVRRAIGIRTIFNIIGPLVNPCTNLSGQVIGVPELNIAETLVLTMNESGMKNIMLINSGDGLDELSCTCKNDITLITGNETKRIRFHPKEIGLESAGLDDIIVRTKEESIRDTLKVIYGDGDKHKQNIVFLNASAALVTSQIAADFREGVEIARDAVRDGRAQKLLSEYIRRCGQKETLIKAEKKFLQF